MNIFLDKMKALLGDEFDDFLQKNSFSETQISFVKNLFTEAAANKFVVIIEHAK